MRRLFTGLVLAALVAGCSKENDVDVGTPQPQDVTNLGAPCDANDTTGYCGGGVCVSGICRQKCGTDAECKGSICLNDKAGNAGGCRLPSEETCTTSKPCSSALLSCGLDATCRSPCSSKLPCPRNDQICIEGSCFGKLEEGASEWLCDNQVQGSFRCSGAVLQVCDIGGLGWVEKETCESNKLCANGTGSGACQKAACHASDNACDGAEMKICNADLTKLESNVCASAPLCEQGLQAKSCIAPTCVAGELSCQGTQLRKCKADRTGWEAMATCQTQELCGDSVTAQSFTCTEPVCDVGQRKCQGADLYVCNTGRNGWTFDASCQTEALCADGLLDGGTACAGPSCSDGQKKCSGAVMQVCNAGHNGWDTLATCPTEALCTAGLQQGVCASSACSPGDLSCDADKKTLLECNASQDGWITKQSCPFVCSGPVGTAACTGSCVPGATQCSGSIPQTCDDTGSWQGTTACAGDTPTCCNGQCKLAVTNVQAGGVHTCAQLSDGTVWCWGRNQRGQLGNPNACSPAPCSVSTPVKTALTKKVIALSGEGSALGSCAVADDNSLWCWGDNMTGQMGNGTNQPNFQYDPVQVNISGVQVVSAARFNTCVLKDDNTLWCWGQNTYGQAGNGTTSSIIAPTQVTSFGTAAYRVAAGQPCAIVNKMQVWCWGENDIGQVGVGDTSPHTTPVMLGLGYSDNVEVESNGGTSCVRKQGGNLYCWGDNTSGMVGDGTTTHRSSPFPIPGLSNVAQVSVGESFTCVRISDGTIYCWGANDRAQIGDGTIAGPRTTPYHSHASVFATSVKSVSAGGGHACVIREGGTLWCWGADDYGQLGNATTSYYVAAPAQVKGLGTCEQ